MITYHLASTTQDLQAILDLQQLNMAKALSAEEAREQGFITVDHDMELLQAMNTPYPHIIARSGEELAAYALVMLREFKEAIPMLVPLFETIDGLVFQGNLLGDSSYFIMGQICIAKAYRGQGVFDELYQQYKKYMAPHFDYLITEIAQTNLRSRRAHARVGFEEIHSYSTGSEDWVIVIWDWKKDLK